MASSLPAVLTALTTLVTTDLPGVQIIEGEPSTYPAPELFIIGDVTGQDMPAVIMGGHPQLFQESYDLTCRLRTYKGGTDIEARRVRGVAMKDAVRDGVAADMSLGISAALRCHLANYTVRAGFDPSGKGALCEIDLTFHVDNLEA